jgi:hypothetical protein
MGPARSNKRGPEGGESMSSGQPDMTDVRVGRVMLLRRDKLQRIAVETEIRDRRPRYGEMVRAEEHPKRPTAWLTTQSRSDQSPS